MMITWAWSLLLLLLSAILWYLFDDTSGHVDTVMKLIGRSWRKMIVYKNQLKQKEKGETITCTASTSSKIPRGTSGWPLIGETLEFIASGYSSRPVTFMEKRKSLYVLSSPSLCLHESF